LQDLTRHNEHLSRREGFGNYSPISLTLILREVVEKMPLKITSKQMKERMVTGKNIRLDLVRASST